MFQIIRGHLPQIKTVYCEFAMAKQLKGSHYDCDIVVNHLDLH